MLDGGPKEQHTHILLYMRESEGTHQSKPQVLVVQPVLTLKLLCRSKFLSFHPFTGVV